MKSITEKGNQKTKSVTHVTGNKQKMIVTSVPAVLPGSGTEGNTNKLKEGVCEWNQ